MYKVTTNYKGQCATYEVESNDEANVEVRRFLACHRPSMYVTCSVENTLTGKVTRVARSITGSKVMVLR